MFWGPRVFIKGPENKIVKVFLAAKHISNKAKKMFNVKILTIEQYHTTYRKNNNLEKCVGIGLNGFHIKWIIGTHCNWKNQNPGSRFGATS